MCSEEAYYLYNNDGSMQMNLINYVLSYDTFVVTKGHCHHVLELNLFKSGKGFVNVDGKQYKVMPGDIFIFNNIEVHELSLTPGSVLEVMVVHFEPEFVWAEGGNSIDSRFLKIFFERSENFQNRLERKNPATKEIKKLMLEMESEFKSHNPGYELAIKVKLLGILTHTVRDFKYILEENDKDYTHKHDIISIKRVMEYIDVHIAEEIKLEDLASISHITPSYFSTLFKKYNRISPLEYVQEKRIQRAVEFLKNSDKSILEIAALCGFNNMSNFYKTFRKVTGTVPTDFRKLNKYSQVL